MYIKIIVTTVGVPIWYDVSYKSVFHCLQISFSTALELVRIDSHVYLERSGRQLFTIVAFPYKTSAIIIVTLCALDCRSV